MSPTGSPSYGLAADGGDLDTFWVQVVDRVIRTGSYEVVQDLRDRFPGLIEPGPLGPLAPDQAVVLPLTVIGGAGPVGAAVLGVNPYRQFDEEPPIVLLAAGPADQDHPDRRRRL